MAEGKTLRETSLAYSVDVDEIQLAQHPLIIERRGKPVAVVVSFDEYRRFSAWREERAARRAWVLEQDPRHRMSAEEWQAHFEAMDRFAAHFDDVTPEELEAEITEAIATVRIEERATAVFQEVGVDLRIL
jgi:hypothetical protein